MIGCLVDVNLRVVKHANIINFVHATSLLTTQHWNLFIWLNINLPALKKLTFFLVLFFDLISILDPSSSLFYFRIAFYLSLSSYESLSTSSLFTPLILLKIKLLVNLLIFYTLRATWAKWQTIRCKRWNGKEDPTLYLVGQSSCFQKQLCCLQTVVLVIGYRFGWQVVLLCWISKTHYCWNMASFQWCLFYFLFPWILKTHCYQNAASVHWCPFCILFHWILFEQKGKRCQWMWKNGFYFHPTISHP